MMRDPSAIVEALRAATHGEAEAVAFLERHRWGDSPACPLCGTLRVYRMRAANGAGRNKDFRWRCRDCKRMYSVRTQTVFAETRLPLLVWCYALWSACSSKKGVSALQISLECEISYKSALFLMRRICSAMKEIGAPKQPGHEAEPNATVDNRIGAHAPAQWTDP